MQDGNGGNTIPLWFPTNDYSVEATVTQAQINAGFTLLNAIGPVTYKVVAYFLKVNGAFATCTDVRLSDTSAGPVDITTIAIAGLGNGVVVTEGTTANVTFGTFAAAL